MFFEKEFLLVVFLTIHCSSLISQNILKGKIKDKETGQPLENVVVFVNNTSFSSTSDKSGNYKLAGLPSGINSLIVEYLGYSTQNFSVNINSGFQIIDILLEKKIQALPEIIFKAPLRDGYTEWGPLFISLLLGTSANSSQCYIENYKVLEFRFDALKSVLKVSAGEPLLIKNKSLGYEIRYSLEDFEYELNSKIIHFNGNAFFVDLATSNSSRRSQWIENRKKTYYGSILHFMRAFFVNQLDREGFRIISFEKVPNRMKLKALELFRKSDNGRLITINQDFVGNYVVTKEKDSTDYYCAFLDQKDSINRGITPADSLGYRINSNTAGFYSNDSLEIQYLKQGYPAQYLRIIKSAKGSTFQSSHFLFIHKSPIEIFSNGFYTKQYDLLIKGYLGWYGSLATTLPFDYSP